MVEADSTPQLTTQPTTDRWVRLADHTTLRLGGPARRFVRAQTEAEVVEAVVAADVERQPLLILGGGSNLVVADAGFDGTVVHVAHRGVARHRGSAVVQVDIAAGEPWDDVVADTVADGLAGLECLSGIPGLAGATPMQNVGAYGAEVADVAAGVRVYDRVDRHSRVLAAQECGFGYRTSALKGQQRFVVLGIRLALAASNTSAPIRYPQLADALGVAVGDRAPIADVRSAVLSLRAGKGMLIDPADPDSVSAGSFFTNPIVPAGQLPPGAPAWPAGTEPARVKTSAAWLIEHAGFGRGYGDGRVGLSTKHTLALVNRGGATTAELVDLARAIRDGVLAAYGIELEVEPTLVGVQL